MDAYLFVGGVCDGQRIQTDGSDFWLVPYPPTVRVRAYPEGIDVSKLIGRRSTAPYAEKYERRTWVQPGQPPEYRYVFVGQV